MLLNLSLKFFILIIIFLFLGDITVLILNIIFAYIFKLSLISFLKPLEKMVQY